MNLPRCLNPILLGLIFPISLPLQAEWKVQVEAGESTRRGTPVHLDVEATEVKAGLLAGEKRLIARSGEEVRPVQVEALSSGKLRLWWRLGTLDAGESRDYLIENAPADASTPVAFHWKKTSGEKLESTDLLLGDRALIRYMHTPFRATDIETTKKIYHMVYAPDGSRFITKGAGGRFPHHRGIYFGYNRCQFDGKSMDVWHGAKGEHQLHVELLATEQGPVFGGHRLKIHWNDREGKPFIEETRSLRCYDQPDGEMLIEWTSHLTPTGSPVSLKGDRQHAGVQFRAAQTVAENSGQTRYLRPAAWASLDPKREVNDKKHVDLPWNAIQYDVGDQGYTVAYLSDPSNPDGAEFSERLYGRFGEFFTHELTRDRPLSVRYRWWIRSNREVTREEVQARHDDLVSPPRVTLR